MSVVLTNSKQPLFDDNYYQRHFIATVRFDGEKMIVEGGKRELKKASYQTNECFVKDSETQKEVKLVLVDNAWVRAA